MADVLELPPHLLRQDPRSLAVDAWLRDGLLTYRADRDQYITRSGVVFDPYWCLNNDVTFANLALAVQAGA